MLRLQRRLFLRAREPAAELPASPSGAAPPKKAAEAGGEEVALMAVDDELAELVAAVEPVPTRAWLTMAGAGIAALLLAAPGMLIAAGSRPSAWVAITSLVGALMFLLALVMPMLAVHAQWVLGKVPPQLQDR